MDFSSYIHTSADRLAELESEISHFDFSGPNAERFQSLNREYTKLKKLLEAWKSFNETKSQISDNKEMLAAGGLDAEMTDLVTSDLKSLE